MQISKLSSLKVGEVGIIYKIDPTCLSKRRLQDLGFISGEKIKCSLISPLGDPFAYTINDSLIALRCEDASKITVQT